MWTCWRCGSFNTAGNVCYQCGAGSEKSKRGEAAPLKRAEAEDAEKPKRIPELIRPPSAETVPPIPLDPNAPDNLFILQPRKYQRWNKLSRADFSSQYPTEIIDVVVSVCTALLSIFLFVVGATAEDLDGRGSWFMASAFFMGLFLMGWALWSRNTAKRPKSPPNTPPDVRLYGTLVILETIARPNGNSNVFVTYRLTSPTSGKTLTQREMFLNSNPQTWHGTPTPGCPVAVAYWDDEHFRIL